MLLHEPFAATARQCPGKEALICDGRRYTFAALDAHIAELATLLHARGVRPGDRIALLLDNGLPLVAGIMAAARIGAVFMPVNPLTRAAKLGYLLDDSRAVALITHTSLRAGWAPCLASSRWLHTCVVDGGTAEPGEQCVAYPQAGQASPSPIPHAGGRCDTDLAAILYTSGSTGEPKGVMLSHRNMAAALRSVLAYLPIGRDDIILCALPLSFGYGLYHFLMSASTGATLVLEQGAAFPLQLIARLAEERATVFPVVPTLLGQLLSSGGLARTPLPALRVVTNAAAALPAGYIAQLRAALPGVALYSMYGLTECKRVTYLPPEELARRPDSVGRGMPFQEHWLVDDAGNRLPDGAEGELVVRGPHVMLGYWEKPGLTAERLKAHRDGEYVLHTGDVFRTDREGWLYFVARKDDIIKTRGEKVSPREVENALYSMPGVLEAAVIGVPDPVLGAAVKAFLALAPGATLSAREVQRFCLSQLESFMVPKYVEFVTELPKTDNGKIRKTGLQ